MNVGYGLEPVLRQRGVLDAQVSGLSGRDGPERTFAFRCDAAMQLLWTGHWCMDAALA